MILKSPGSRLSIVNLFADYILNQIPKEEETIIQVIDCINFYVIKGKTTHNEPLDMAKIKDDFISEFESLLGNIKLTHTIDLIEYNVSIKPLDSKIFTYHNTQNCSYNSQQIKSFEEDPSISYDYQYTLKPINNEFSYVSEFPHGYSLNQGRLLFYYGKHIFYNIPSSYPLNSITFEISTKKDESGDQIFLAKNKTNVVDQVLTSAILDMFDFDMSSLEQEIKKVDWFIEVTNPLDEYDFLKKKIKDFIIF